MRFIKITIFSILILIPIYCSSHKIAYVPQECSEELSALNELMNTLSRYDIRDVRTKDLITKFFKDTEQAEIFISSVIYKIREQEAFYGTFESFRILSSKIAENACEFEVEIKLRRKYPVEDIRIYNNIVFVKENGSYYIQPPQYIGEIKERKQITPPQISY
ncbi:MAG: hypothetical protein NZ927_03370 [Candidatus Calescibacterium sp.]|nr:hypothetical protein [Candidatus Calescibacterium sp.]MCX7734675.1 hypothetical protein [bacterium]MDW8087800.1 hypothetical protein [Candidatus Calescibacterium sp.]